MTEASTPPDSGATQHESRLTQALRALLAQQRVAALGTLGEDGAPFVSMVPFALEPGSGGVVIHVSGLAAHTRNMQLHPQVALMVMRAEAPGEPVHALERISMVGVAGLLAPGTQEWTNARAAYLGRFPEAEPMTELGDFRFAGIQVTGARQVAGFGAARSVDAQTLAQVLKAPHASLGGPAA